MRKREGLGWGEGGLRRLILRTQPRSDAVPAYGLSATASRAERNTAGLRT
jgi:hypothetical protein